MPKRPFNGSPTVDGYYTTFDSSEVHRVEESDGDTPSGSSDFSTAQVAFINADTTTTPYLVRIFHITNDAYISTEEISVSDSVSVDIPLYKGRAEAELMDLAGISESYLPTATGGVTFEMPKFIITGDGTITAKGRQPN